jgi:hypothetical protein
LTSKGVDKEGELIDFLWFKNCEMLPFHDFWGSKYLIHSFLSLVM